MTLNFLDRFFENFSSVKFQEIYPLDSEMVDVNTQTDRQTNRQINMTKLIAARRDIANAPK